MITGSIAKAVLIGKKGNRDAPHLPNAGALGPSLSPLKRGEGKTSPLAPNDSGFSDCEYE
jgi:hypothetical protein